VGSVVTDFVNTETRRRWPIAAVLSLAIQPAAAGGVFGEGYSSAEPGGTAAIHFRVFTIYTGQEACEKSPVPTELRILPNPLRLNVGDRIHRTNGDEHASELVIEAYDKDGLFLPSVPIVVNLIDVQSVVVSRSDWDYFEAIRAGEDELVVGWACPGPDGSPVEVRIRILVTRVNAEGV
jgi:hypothetical protein